VPLVLELFLLGSVSAPPAPERFFASGVRNAYIFKRFGASGAQAFRRLLVQGPGAGFSDLF
jgi:hypothetical protein